MQNTGLWSVFIVVLYNSRNFRNINQQVDTTVIWFTTVFLHTEFVHVSELTGSSSGRALIVVWNNYLTIFWSLVYVEELMEILPVYSEYT